MQLLQRVNEYLRMDKHVKVAVNIKGRSVTKTTNCVAEIVSCILLTSNRMIFLV